MDYMSQARMTPSSFIRSHYTRPVLPHHNCKSGRPYRAQLLQLLLPRLLLTPSRRFRLLLSNNQSYPATNHSLLLPSHLLFLRRKSRLKLSHRLQPILSSGYPYTATHRNHCLAQFPWCLRYLTLQCTPSQHPVPP